MIALPYSENGSIDRQKGDGDVRGARREVEALKFALQEARQAEQAARAELGALRSEGETAKLQAAEHRRRVEFFEGLIAHCTPSVHAFGESTKAVQGSLATLVGVLRQETQSAARASSETANSQQAVRRFAVVADEVRKLAERTTASTSEISGLVARVQEQAGELRQAAEVDPEELAAIREAGAQAFASIDKLLELSRHMTQTIAAIALRSFVETAKTDHLVFKMEIYRVFLGLSDKQADDFARDKVCRLGKWYYEGDGKVYFSRLPGYSQLEPPHLRVHAHGKAAVEALRAGDLARGLASLR